MCMGLTLTSSHCIDGKDAGVVLGGEFLSHPSDVTNCVCADPKQKKVRCSAAHVLRRSFSMTDA